MTIGLVVIHFVSVQKSDEIFRSIILENRQLKLMLFIVHFFFDSSLLWMLEQVFQFGPKMLM